jgi:hypothetical protein
MALVTGYATVADVQTLLNSASGTGITIGAGSVPTETQVEGFIDQVAAEVNSVLRSIGYTVPVTGSNDILMLTRYVAQKAAAKTYDAGYGGFGETPHRIKEWEEEYKTFLERLISRDMQLVDSDPRSKFGVILAKVYTET